MFFDGFSCFATRLILILNDKICEGFVLKTEMFCERFVFKSNNFVKVGFKTKNIVNGSLMDFKFFLNKSLIKKCKLLNYAKILIKKYFLNIVITFFS